MRLLLLLLLPLLLSSCAHGDLEARIESARTAAHGKGATRESAIAWSDAVAEGLKAGVIKLDDGDLQDALYSLEKAEAGAGVDGAEPYAAARGRLLLAAGRDEEAEASFVVAAKARPAKENLQPLVDRAIAKKDKSRVRALCVAGAFVVESKALKDWVEQCASGADVSDETMTTWLFPEDRQRLTGTEPQAAPPSGACVSRCRVSLYRAVAACTSSGEACSDNAAKAHGICITNCEEGAAP